MKVRFESKYSMLDDRVHKLTEDIKQLDNDAMYNTDVTNTFKKYEGVTEITRELLGDLIDRIVIDKDKKIKIRFNFQDEIKSISNSKLN